jgi:hypothetical protein
MYRAVIPLIAIFLLQGCSSGPIEVFEGWPPFSVSECQKIYSKDSLPQWVSQKVEHLVNSGYLINKTQRFFPHQSFKGVPEFTYGVKCNDWYSVRYFWWTLNDREFAGVQIWIVLKSKTKIYIERLPYE